MLFQQIDPFVRYVRFLDISEKSAFYETNPYDARIFYVVQGEGQIEVGGKVSILPTGSILYLNSGIPYRLLPHSVRYLAINFDFTNHFAQFETPIPPVRVTESTIFKELETVRFEDQPQMNEMLQIDACYSTRTLLDELNCEFNNNLPIFVKRHLH